MFQNKMENNDGSDPNLYKISPIILEVLNKVDNSSSSVNMSPPYGPPSVEDSGYTDSFEQAGVFGNERSVSASSSLSSPPEAAVEEQEWIIPGEEIRKGEQLGTGSFGTVFRGVWTSRTYGAEFPVALKLIRGDDNQKAFITEAELLKAVSKEPHPAVMQMWGVVQDNEPPLLVTEYCAGGCLLTYLQSPEGIKLVPAQRLSMCIDLGLGLDHLHKNKILHRDLAARNVLRTLEGRVKLSDFGKAQVGELNKEDYKLAIRWQAPEVIVARNSVYTREADCYSLAVLFWEVWSHGAAPYAAIVDTFPSIVVKGGWEPLPQPTGCPPELYSVLLQCFCRDPAQRPSTSVLVSSLLPPLRASIGIKAYYGHENKRIRLEQEARASRERNGCAVKLREVRLSSQLTVSLANDAFDELNKADTLVCPLDPDHKRMGFISAVRSRFKSETKQHVDDKLKSGEQLEFPFSVPLPPGSLFQSLLFTRTLGHHLFNNAESTAAAPIDQQLLAQMNTVIDDLLSGLPSHSSRLVLPVPAATMLHDVGQLDQFVSLIVSKLLANNLDQPIHLIIAEVNNERRETIWRALCKR